MQQAASFHGSAPAPSFLSIWIPVLTSFSNGQWCGSVSQINPFLPNLLLVMVFPPSNRNPKTHPQTDGPGFYKKAVWASHRGKPLSTTTSWLLNQLLPPGSCPFWGPVLIFFDDEQWCGCIIWKSKTKQKPPFLPQATLATAFHQSNDNSKKMFELTPILGDSEKHHGPPVKVRTCGGQLIDRVLAEVRLK